MGTFNNKVCAESYRQSGVIRVTGNGTVKAKSQDGFSRSRRWDGVRSIRCLFGINSERTRDAVWAETEIRLQASPTERWPAQQEIWSEYWPSERSHISPKWTVFKPCLAQSPGVGNPKQGGLKQGDSAAEANPPVADPWTLSACHCTPHSQAAHVALKGDLANEFPFFMNRYRQCHQGSSTAG